MAERQNSAAAPDASPAEQHHDLGIAGRMAAAFIRSPLSPILLIASMALGLLGLIFTPRQEDPQISVPMVDIFVQYPGASSSQVATLVANPLERLMSEIPGVEHVYSASRRTQAMVTVQFEVGEQMGPSLVKLYDKLQSNLDKIPPGVSQPLVKPKGIDDVPTVAVTLWARDVDDSALRNLALDILQHIKEIPNTGPGFIIGGRAEQIRVEVTPDRLASFGLSLGQIANAIQSANSEVTSGSLELGGRSFTVLSGRFLRTARDVQRLVVGVRDGAPVHMADVAQVFQAPQETRTLVRHYTGQALPAGLPKAGGEPAVTIAVAKTIGSNGVVVANAILAKVEALKGYLIPDNVNVTVTRDYGKTANNKVNDLLFKLFIATMAVTVLVWMTLGMRAAIVVLVVIPVVILVTVFGAWMLGFTIDRVSLFALIFAIGILVDDAIVVVENMFRRWLEKGGTDVATAVDAVREVGNPTIVATFTVIAALLPMGFVGDLMGPYMMPIPALGSVAMLFSLFAAFIFTPWLAYHLRPPVHVLEKMERREERSQERIGGRYRALMEKLLNSRPLAWLVLIAILVAWVLSCLLFYTTAVTVKMLPNDNKSEFNVVLNMPAGTAMPVTAGVAQELAAAVRANLPEVVDFQVYAGTASPYNFNGMVRHYYLRQDPWHADIQIKLLDKGLRERSSHQIALAAREILTPIAKKHGARITVAEMPPGPPVLQTLVAEIYGPNDEIRRQVARDMTGIFERADNVADVDNYMEATHDIVRFQVNLEKAMRHGITVDTINRNLAMAMGGFKVGDVKQGRNLEPTLIILQVPHSVRAVPGRLNNLPVPGASGNSVPLSELGRFVQVEDDPIIYHKDLRAVEYVVGDTIGRLGAPIYGMFSIGDLLLDYTTPDGGKMEGHWISAPKDSVRPEFKWDGEWRVTYITFRDMGIAFAAAMLLIYILVVWEFNSFKLPLIIISPIPLTLIGIIPGHWLLGAEFTATSMIGFIALAGIIVRNSILLVDFAEAEIERGAEIREALCRSGQVRMRPIMLTALALVAGSSVILFDPIFQGMAISLLFGVLVATLLSLIVIPMGCDTFRSALCARNGGGESGGGAAPAPAPTPADATPREPGRVTAFLSNAISVPYYLVRAVVVFMLWPLLKRVGTALVSPFRRKGDPDPQTTSPASAALVTPPAAEQVAPSAPQTPARPESAVPPVVKTVRAKAGGKKQTRKTGTKKTRSKKVVSKKVTSKKVAAQKTGSDTKGQTNHQAEPATKTTQRSAVQRKTRAKAKRRTQHGIRLKPNPKSDEEIK